MWRLCRRSSCATMPPSWLLLTRRRRCHPGTNWSARKKTGWRRLQENVRWCEAGSLGAVAAVGCMRDGGAGMVEELECFGRGLVRAQGKSSRLGPLWMAGMVMWSRDCCSRSRVVTALSRMCVCARVCACDTHTHTHTHTHIAAERCARRKTAGQLE